jgi:hypothetical protein
MSLFESQAIKDVIEYKWETYAHHQHYFGFAMHIFYIATITLYIINTFLIGQYGQATNSWFTYAMVVGIIYPFCYDTLQFYEQGWDYFKDPWNYTDLLFQWSGIINIIFKFTIPEQDDMRSVISMVILLLLALIKTMFFMRIFDNLSPLVTLIKTCIYDLREFMKFYAIIVFMFALMLGVLGYQNFSNDPRFELWEE